MGTKKLSYYSARLSAFGGKDVLFRIDVFFERLRRSKKTSIRNLYSLRRSRNKHAEWFLLDILAKVVYTWE
jgi:hypothetical protein